MSGHGSDHEGIDRGNPMVVAKYPSDGRNQDRLAIRTHVAANTIDYVVLANVASSRVQTSGGCFLRVVRGAGNANNATSWYARAIVTLILKTAD